METPQWSERTELLLGKEKLERLNSAHVLVVGLGGVGAYAAEMGGVDLIVFTGGVGENSRELRRSVCAGLEFMGVEFDPAANEVRGEDKILSTPASRVKVAVIATDEELMIATDTYNLVK